MSRGVDDQFLDAVDHLTDLAEGASVVSAARERFMQRAYWLLYAMLPRATFFDEVMRG